MIDLIVVGAGPAGLFGALRAAVNGFSVLVLEKNPKAGKKLLVTGSGQCNLTNSVAAEEFIKHYGGKGRFVKPALLAFPPAALMEFFRSRGISIALREDGKVFPASYRAGDILFGLLAECKKHHVEIRYGRRVTDLTVKGTDFTISTKEEQWQTHRVLIACGGASWPGTGSTGDGYTLAAALGHRIIPTRPALAPVYPQAWDGASCSGIALPKTQVSLWRDNRKLGERTGDVLFTHKGLSGPGILDYSREFVPGDEIRLQLHGLADRGQTDREILDICAASPRKGMKNILSGLGLPEALALLVLGRCNISPETTGSTLTKSSRQALSEALTGLRYTIQRLGNFSEAMVTAGGVDTDQVNPKTMESRLVQGLYFAGEVLDVDGDTGGFNLQFAFSSAALAATGIVRSLDLDEEPVLKESSGNG